MNKYQFHKQTPKTEDFQKETKKINGFINILTEFNIF